MIRKAGLSKVKLQSYLIAPHSDWLTIRDTTERGIERERDRETDIETDRQTESNEDNSESLQQKSVVVKQGNREVVFEFDDCFPCANTSSNTSSNTITSTITSSTDADGTNSTYINVDPASSTTTTTTVDSLTPTNVIPSELLPLIASSVDMVMLGYGATLLLYITTAPVISNLQGVDGELQQVMTTITDRLYEQIKLHEQATPGERLEDSIPDRCTIQLSCYELLDTQLKDLLGKPNGTEVRMRETEGQVVIEGLRNVIVEHSQQMRDFISSALARRTFLVNGTDDSIGSKKVLQSDILESLLPTVIGSVGNTVIQIRVITKETLVQNNIMNVIHRESVLHIISLATADALNAGIDHKGFKSFGDVGSLKKNRFDWIPLDEQVSKNNQLKNSFKTLATFSRVINALVEKNKIKESQSVLDIPSKSLDKKASPAVAAGSTIHVPFRDSTLTRLLRPSLEGNCFLSMITMPSNTNVDSASRALRFASQIGKLFNMIWINEQIETLKRSPTKQQFAVGDTDQVEHTLEQRICSTKSSNAPTEFLKDMKTNRDNNTANVNEDGIAKFNISADVIRNEMNLLANDLNHLEKMRDEILRNLSVYIKPVKQYNSIAYMNYQIAEQLIQKIETNIEEQHEHEAITTEGLNPNGVLANQTSSTENDVQGKGDLSEAQSSVNSGFTEKTNELTKSNPNDLMELTHVERTQQPQLQNYEQLLDSPLKAMSSGKNIKLDSIPRGISQNGIRSITVTSSGSAKKTNKLVSLDDSGPIGQSNSDGKPTANQYRLSNPTGSKSSASLKLLPSKVTDEDASFAIPSLKSSSEKVKSLRPVIAPQRGESLSAKSFGKQSGSKASIDNNNSNNNRAVGASGAKNLVVPPPSALTPSSKKKSSAHHHQFNNDKDYVDELELKKSSEVVSSPFDSDADHDYGGATRGALPSPSSSSLPNILNKHLSPSVKLSPQFLGGVSTSPSTPIKTPMKSTLYQSNLTNSSTQQHIQFPGLADEDLLQSEASYYTTSRVRNDNEELDESCIKDSEDIINGFNAMGTKNQPFASSIETIGSNDGSFPSKKAHFEYRTYVDEDDSPKKSFSHGIKLQPIVGSSRDDIEQMSDKSTINVDLPQLSRSVKQPKKPLKENPNDFNSDDDDNLTPAERKFLRQVATGNDEGALQSINNGVNIHVKNTFERDAMQIAARNGNVPMLKMLYLRGGSLSTRGLRGDTLFHLACYNGHIDTMRWLHRMGGLPEAVDMFGQTVIHVAARRGELAVLKYLRNDLNMDGFQKEDFDGRSPMDCIPRRGPPELDLCREYLTDIFNEDYPDDSDEGFKR